MLKKSRPKNGRGFVSKQKDQTIVLAGLFVFGRFLNIRFLLCLCHSPQSDKDINPVSSTVGTGSLTRG
jgi:hypothetical protein